MHPPSLATRSAPQCWHAQESIAKIDVHQSPAVRCRPEGVADQFLSLEETVTQHSSAERLEHLEVY